MTELKAKITKGKCPECGSEDVNVLSLPLGDDEEYLYCNHCRKIIIITKVKEVEKQEKS